MSKYLVRVAEEVSYAETRVMMRAAAVTRLERVALARALRCAARGFASLVDMRSDTVTRPSEPMRQAMAKAEVGDDVYGEDPTVNELEERVAHLLGKQAGLFVPSGTMGNLISVGVHCGRGDEVILGNKSHIFKYEAGGASAFMGVSYHTLPNQKDGTLALDAIEAAIRPDDDHCPRTKLVCLENTQNSCGGVVLPLEYMNAVEQLCRHHNLKFHLDGARIMNAAVASKQQPAAVAKPFDTISVCLSKGLGCPVGSVIVGPNCFIHEARRLRKALGGGMRQAGVIAAAGLYAIEHNIHRLADDHENAKTLAEGLANISGIRIDASAVQTNIVFFDVTAVTAPEFVRRLKMEGVLMGGYSDTLIRAVTNLNVSADDIQRTLSVIAKVLA